MSAPSGEPAVGPAERAVRRACQGARRAFVAAWVKGAEGADGARPGEGVGSARSVPATGDLGRDAWPPERRAPSSLRTAAELAVARAVDGAPGLAADLRAGCVALIDVPDPELFEDVRACWREIVLGKEANVVHLGKVDPHDCMGDFDAAVLVAAEPAKSRDRAGSLERAALDALSWAMPIVGISPFAASHMPSALLAAARHRIALPPLDGALVAATIDLVTGGRCGAAHLDGVELPVRATDLAVAVRFDRDPGECVRELRRLQAARSGKRGGRELSLDQLHGLDPAVAWARGALSDLAAWRRGEIPWSAVDHGVLLDGPPGTGKSLFAAVFAAEAKLPIVAASLAKWQGAGHLGDLLKSMRRDFDLARAQSPCVLFVDEIDAFGDRTTFKSDHADYSIQVVNGFIELLDGMGGREGLIYIGASNDSGRCDPAILRSGRFNRILRIDLPDAAARAGMLRVRLGRDLPAADLGRLARYAHGSSGADIERAVNDARRAARQAGRRLAEADLVAALRGADVERPPELVRRTAVHEAGHAVALVLIGGATDFTVTIRSQGSAVGWVEKGRAERAGTRSDVEAEIAMLLAGRAAEALVLGDASAGGGGLAGSDLDQATKLAAAMVGSLGHAGPHPLLFVSPISNPAAVLAVPALRAAALEILVRAERRARHLLEANRHAFERVVGRLVEARHLGGEEVAALIAEAGVDPARKVSRRAGGGVAAPSRSDATDAAGPAGSGGVT